MKFWGGLMWVLCIDNLVKTISSYEIQWAGLTDDDPIKKAYQGIIKTLQEQLK